MSISKVPNFSSRTSRHDASHETDENHIQRRKLAKRLLSQNDLSLKKNQHSLSNPAVNALLQEQAVSADSTDANLFREKLQSKDRDSRKHLLQKNSLFRSAETFAADNSHLNFILPNTFSDSDLSNSNQFRKNNNPTISSVNNASVISEFSKTFDTPFETIDNNEKIIQSSQHKNDNAALDTNILPSDLIDKMTKMGSLIGAGKSSLVINQVKQDLDVLVSTLATFGSKFNDLTSAEKENFEINIDFLEGYCEVSKLEAEERIHLNEQFQILRENLNFNPQVISTQLLNSSAHVDSPLTGISMRAKAARSALIQPPVSDLSNNFSTIDKNRRILQSLNEDKKQSEDTLALKVQRSV